jgi:hypothetical protein
LRAVIQDDLPRCAHKLASPWGAGDKSLNFMQDSEITRGQPQLKELAANPIPFSARRARPRIASPINQRRGNSGFCKELRAEACQMVM